MRRLKAAIHHSVGKICEEIAELENVQFSRTVIAALSELTCQQLQIIGRDLECFSRHAKRTSVNCDDIKLLARRNPVLLQHLQEVSEQLTGGANPRARKTKKKKATETEEKEQEVVDVE
ncbi:unnamed protein product [Darwinula stevensoni]|uniref:Centromere protein S n=1 Tax=Darwinula stevensoni TaxID=69355 RepID=A0A7R9A0S3_9CRUS|nr:unnamed protein product [Darwinula stevensoni]CAG0886185.1 unnamed protein product [Darwinula stevensoni]